MSELRAGIPTRSAVGRWSVDRYVQLLRPGVSAGGLAVILLVLWQWSQLLVVAVQVGVCAWLGVVVARRQGQRIEALAAGAIAGVALGAVAGISRFVLTPNAYWFMNIIFETLLFGAIGAMICASVLTFIQSRTKLLNK